MKDYNLKIVDYKNTTKTTLPYAFDVDENIVFGDLSDIEFKSPFHQYNGYGELIYDDNNEKLAGYANQFYKNENMVKINDNYYVIKSVKLSRNNNNEKIFDISGIEKSVELTYKNIPILDLSPLAFNPVRVDATIANLLSAKFNITEDNVVSQSTNTVTLATTASATNDVYNGMYIAIIDGSGQGQTLRIVDYDGATKVATLDSTPSRALDTSSLYRIYNFTWKVGNIDNLFLEKTGVDIKRYYKFQDKTIMECLNEIATRLDGFLTYTYYYDETYDEFVNEVNLVKPNEFNGSEIRYKKNLISSSRVNETESQIYTRLFPYGEADLTINSIGDITRTDSGVTYNEHTSGQSYIENFQYYLSLGYSLEFCRKNFVNDKELRNDLYVDVQDLYDYAVETLENESIPKSTYEISYVDLSRVTNVSYDDFESGDTIRIIDDDVGLDFYATVIRKPIRWDSIEESSVVLQNFIDDLGTYFNKIIDRLSNI